MEAFCLWLRDEVGAKIIVQCVFLLLLFVANGMWTWWTQRKYGLHVAGRLCGVERDGEILKLVDKVIVDGTCLELLGKKTAQLLIQAIRNAKDGELLKGQAWETVSASRVLKRIENRVSARFADGALGRVLRDKDVITQKFTAMMFRRSKNEVSVIIIQAEDAAMVVSPPQGRTLVGDIKEKKEIEQMLGCINPSNPYQIEIELSR